jgi:protocatechuate 3,4-dioxygenase beta subunit
MKSLNRKDFLKNVGLVGLGMATAPIWAKDLMDEPSNDDLLKSGNCTALPEETTGPYPLPNSVSATSLVRTDLTEGTQTGIPLTVNLTLINADNDCLPVSGLRVDCWHCNKRGYYSAYDGQPGIDGTQNNAGTTWLRGIQYSDSNGQITFNTIYPGWYTPRATHFHIQIYSNDETLLLTTQLAFPDEINATVNTYYATSGTNSFTNSNDMVFSDSYTEELMTVTGNTTDGYTAVKEIALNAGFTAGVNDLAIETGGQFSQLRNFPNPVVDATTFSFILLQNSDVTITITDAYGKVVDSIVKEQLSSGKQGLKVDLSSLSSGVYYYQMVVKNLTGTFRQTKSMVKV